MTDVPGTVYVLHFHSAYHHARHYTGWTANLPARLRDHHRGAGARLMEVITQAGISWSVARTIPGTRSDERKLKNSHNVKRVCPMCQQAIPIESELPL